jgi:hypothetical protein
VAGGADACDPDRRLVRIGLEPGDQSLQILRRQTLLAHDQKRLAADFDDWFQIFQEIERQRIKAAGQHMRRGCADAQRIAVGSRSDRAADTETAGSAADILDDDGLPQNRPDLLPRNRATVSVAPPAGNGTIMLIGRAG